MVIKRCGIIPCTHYLPLSSSPQTSRRRRTIKVSTAKQKKKINLLLPPINYEISLSGRKTLFGESSLRAPEGIPLRGGNLITLPCNFNLCTFWFLFLRTFGLKLLFLNYSSDFLWSQNTTFFLSCLSFHTKWCFCMLDVCYGIQHGRKMSSQLNVRVYRDRQDIQFGE